MDKLLLHLLGMVILALILPFVCILPIIFLIFSRASRNEKARKGIDSYASLGDDWDSHGSSSISWAVIDVSKKVVDLVSSMGGEVSWTLPTSDDTILMLFTVIGKTFKIEVDKDSIGVQLINWVNNGLERQFYDATIDNLKEVLTNAK